jgi:hypothetical protein
VRRGVVVENWEVKFTAHERNTLRVHASGPAATLGPSEKRHRGPAAGSSVGGFKEVAEVWPDAG